jgi:hypothetical protein
MVGLPDEYVPRGHSSKYPPPLTPRQTRRCHLPGFLFGQRVFGCQLYEVGDDRLNYTLASVARRIQKIFPDTEIEQVESADGQNWRVSYCEIHERPGFTWFQMSEEGIRKLKRAFPWDLASDHGHLLCGPLENHAKLVQVPRRLLPKNVFYAKSITEPCDNPVWTAS